MKSEGDLKSERGSIKEALYDSVMHVYDVFIDVTIKYIIVLLVCNYYFIFFYLGDNTGPVL